METWPKLFAPKNLKESDLWGEVIQIKGFNDFKPSICQLNENVLLMFVMHQHFECADHFAPDQRYAYANHIVMYQSTDNGKTWQSRGHLFEGGEPFATVIDGVIYLSASTKAYRSEDEGRTWAPLPTDAASLGLPAADLPVMGRNFIKLKDGSIAYFLFVLGNCYFNLGQKEEKTGYVVRMTSRDNGKTWEKAIVKEELEFEDGYPHTSLCEAFFFRTPKTNRLMAVSRLFWSKVKPEWLAKIPYATIQEEYPDIDSLSGMILMESEDEGLSWKPVRGVGCTSMMYPGVAYYNDKDFIFTYTQRASGTESPYPHVGVQAIIGHENDDGTFTLDFEHDVIIIDGRTPDYSIQGGGFGVTRILPDGSFITPYSYRKNTKEVDEKLKNGTFVNEETFNRYMENTALFTDCPIRDMFRNASVELKTSILLEALAHERLESRRVTEILRWGFHS